MSDTKTPIPVKNLFYMLCYAWNILPIMNDIKVDSENIKDAYNLLARIFSHGVGKVIRSGFHRSYIEQEDELSTLKGKINVQASINQLSIMRKKLVCTYDDYSTNDIFNQIIKYTLQSIRANASIDKTLRNEIKKQLVFFEGIESVPPTKNHRQKLTYNRNNTTYRMLINIAVMLYDNTFVNEEDGQKLFKDFFRQEQMHKVFETFILNFYAIHLPKSIYKVHAPKIEWHLDDKAHETWGGLFDIDENVGDRRTDIVVENKEKHIQLIIDAKYYHKTLVTSYMGYEEDSVRTGHINQVRGYLLDSNFVGKKVGALVYPLTTKDLNNGKVFPIQGTPIIVKTLDLSDEWFNIEADLLNFVKKIEVAKS